MVPNAVQTQSLTLSDSFPILAVPQHIQTGADMKPCSRGVHDMLRLTRIKIVDSHAILLARPDAEDLPVKVDRMDIFSAAHVQEVPADPLLLSHHQSRQSVPHVAVDGWGRQRSGMAWNP